MDLCRHGRVEDVYNEVADSPWLLGRTQVSRQGHGNGKEWLTSIRALESTAHLAISHPICTRRCPALAVTKEDLEPVKSRELINLKKWILKQGRLRS